MPVCFVRVLRRTDVYSAAYVLRYRSASSTMRTLFFPYYMDYCRNKNRIRCSTDVLNISEHKEPPSTEATDEGKKTRHLTVVPTADNELWIDSTRKVKEKKNDGSGKRTMSAQRSSLAESNIYVYIELASSSSRNNSVSTPITPILHHFFLAIVSLTPTV